MSTSPQTTRAARPTLAPQPLGRPPARRSSTATRSPGRRGPTAEPRPDANALAHNNGNAAAAASGGGRAATGAPVGAALLLGSVAAWVPPLRGQLGAASAGPDTQRACGNPNRYAAVVPLRCAVLVGASGVSGGPLGGPVGAAVQFLAAGSGGSEPPASVHPVCCLFSHAYLADS